jgi:hypothetical protein
VKTASRPEDSLAAQIHVGGDQADAAIQA